MKRSQGKRRGNGQGTLIKRNGYYLWRHVAIGGSTKTITLHNGNGERVTTKADAEKITSYLLLRQQSAKAEAESLSSRIETITKLATLKGLLHKSNIAIAGMWQAWQSSPSYTKGNEGHKETSIRHFTAWINDKHPELDKVADLTPNHAQAYMADYWQSGISPRSYNIRVQQLDIVFRGIAGDSPFAEIPKKREEPESREAFSHEQLEAIWRTLSDASFVMKDKEELSALYVCALWTGLRRGDCCLLQWSCIDLENNIITLTPGKTSGSSRRKITIPIAAPLLTALQKQMSKRDGECQQAGSTARCPYVFPNVAKRYKRCPSSISACTRRLLEASGIVVQHKEKGTNRKWNPTRYGFHSFRHTCASMLANSGASPLVIRDILGHSTIDMTSHYSHISLASKQAALQAIAQGTEAISGTIDSDTDVSIAGVVKALKPASMRKLASHLDGILTTAQKRKILAMLA
jgi:integrase